MIVRVLPDVVGIDKEFDYSVPPDMDEHVRVGTMVRVSLAGRRVGAWVISLDVEPAAGVSLKPIAKVTGWGPPADLVDLAGWAAWRWAGRRVHVLRTASPPAVVRHVGFLAAGVAPDRTQASEKRRVLRLAPLTDRWPLVTEALNGAEAEGGHALVLCPSITDASRLASRIRRGGRGVTLIGADTRPSAGAAEWARAAGGAHVVGARAAAWAPMPVLRRVVVLDEHDEGYQQEQAPTWHARDVVSERAARAGATCMLVSPCPTLEALAWGELVAPAPSAERHGWPTVEVVDRRDEEPGRAGLFAPRLVDVLRSDRRVVCVLNRKGRARLLACTACGELAVCERCGASVQQPEVDRLSCARCGTERPVICLACGGSRFRNLRAGVARVREELEAMVGQPVDEVTASTPPPQPVARLTDSPTSRVVVGTEAALHRVDRSDVVVFLDIDQELGAHRARATEQALSLLVLAARLVRVGGSQPSGRGRVLVQTRQPEHHVLVAVAHGDPSRVVEDELRLRTAMRFPPVTALALVSGPAGASFVSALEPIAAEAGVEVLGPTDGAWLVRAEDSRTLADTLAACPRPEGRLRIEVDPLRL